MLAARRGQTHKRPHQNTPLPYTAGGVKITYDSLRLTKTETEITKNNLLSTVDDFEQKRDLIIQYYSTIVLSAFTRWHRRLLQTPLAYTAAKH